MRIRPKRNSARAEGASEGGTEHKADTPTLGVAVNARGIVDIGETMDILNPQNLEDVMDADEGLDIRLLGVHHLCLLLISTGSGIEA